MVEDARAQQYEELKEKTTVLIGNEAPDLPGGDLMVSQGFYHQWVILPDGTASGKGTDEGVPGANGDPTPAFLGTDTEMVDHADRTPLFTESRDFVDIENLQHWLEVGRDTGGWVPFANDCNTTVEEAINASSPGYPQRGPDGDIHYDKVMRPDGSLHEPAFYPPWVTPPEPPSSERDAD